METLRKRRVGSVTCGLMLVLYGVMFLAHLIQPKLNYDLIFKLWPVILIFLGVEILASTVKKQENIKYIYDFASIILIFLVALFAMIMCVINSYNEYVERAYGVSGENNEGGRLTHEINGTQDFSAGDVESITLNNELLWDIKALPSEDNDIHVSYNGMTRSDDTVKFSQSQDSVTIDIKEDSNAVNVPFLWETYENIGGEMVLYLPKENMVDIKLQNESGEIFLKDISCKELALNSEYGDVKLTDVACTGDFTLNNKYGGVDLEDVACAGNFSQENESGSIKFKNVTCADYAMTNGYGNVRLDQFNCAGFDIENEGGSININGLTAENTDIYSKTGAVEITKGRILNGVMETDSASFTLDGVEAGNVDVKSEYGNIYIINAGKDTDIAAANKSGGVYIRYKEKPDDTLFKLNSEYGSLKIAFENVEYEIDSDTEKVGKIGNGLHNVQIETESGSVSVK